MPDTAAGVLDVLRSFCATASHFSCVQVHSVAISHLQQQQQPQLDIPSFQYLICFDALWPCMYALMLNTADRGWVSGAEAASDCRAMVMRSTVACTLPGVTPNMPEGQCQTQMLLHGTSRRSCSRSKQSVKPPLTAAGAQTTLQHGSQHLPQLCCMISYPPLDSLMIPQAS